MAPRRVVGERGYAGHGLEAPFEVPVGGDRVGQRRGERTQAVPGAIAAGHLWPCQRDDARFAYDLAVAVAGQPRIRQRGTAEQVDAVAIGLACLKASTM